MNSDPLHFTGIRPESYILPPVLRCPRLTDIITCGQIVAAMSSFTNVECSLPSWHVKRGAFLCAVPLASTSASLTGD